MFYDGKLKLKLQATMGPLIFANVVDLAGRQLMCVLRILKSQTLHARMGWYFQCEVRAVEMGYCEFYTTSYITSVVLENRH